MHKHEVYSRYGKLEQCPRLRLETFNQTPTRIISLQLLCTTSNYKNFNSIICKARFINSTTQTEILLLECDPLIMW